MFRFERKTLMIKTANRKDAKLWVTQTNFEHAVMGCISPYPTVVADIKLKYMASMGVSNSLINPLKEQ